ncbi:MAG: PLDc N-terminal domain-containing protein [Propionibacteriaceae bacterium]|nr:PLDc N-terminal domain-containing protein [Propionibacteriaceae bacterium]
MGRVIPILILIALIIYSAVVVVQSDSERVRYLPKSVWLLAVLVLPGLGAVCWWIFGRPLLTDVPPSPPTAPDDDPDFLRSL